MSDTIMYAVCNKCRSSSLTVFFTTSTIGAVCKKCGNFVFETEDIQEFLLKIRDKDKDRTIN